MVSPNNQRRAAEAAVRKRNTIYDLIEELEICVVEYLYLGGDPVLTVEIVDELLDRLTKARRDIIDGGLSN